MKNAKEQLYQFKINRSIFISTHTYRCRTSQPALFNLFSTPSLADLDGITDLLPMQTGKSPFASPFQALLEPFWSPFQALLSFVFCILFEKTCFPCRQVKALSSPPSSALSSPLSSPFGKSPLEPLWSPFQALFGFPMDRLRRPEFLGCLFLISNEHYRYNHLLCHNNVMVLCDHAGK